MSKASEYNSKYEEVNDLMLALDDAEVEVNQSWETETTVYEFDDGSKIVINNSDVSVED